MLTTLHQHPKTVEKIVYASCVLHNMLSIKRPQAYLEVVAEQANPAVPALEWRDADTLLHITRARERDMKVPKSIRDHLQRYYTTVGSVPWQDRMVDT